MFNQYLGVQFLMSIQKLYRQTIDIKKYVATYNIGNLLLCSI